ncbi:MAG: tetratricopeptide repeat protein [Phycisphaerae bacterium]|nr:tetratricopeptide repeat protein [Phycisphaerae bacterium]
MSIIVLFALGVIGAPAVGGSDNPPASVLAVRARQAELHYRLTDAAADTQVELWYTRDRAATWQRWGVHARHDQPLIFDAPGEGLYGFTLVTRDGDDAREAASAPRPYSQPQRWVFIDFTPPLVQWDRIEPADAFASQRTACLRWAAHDSHLPSRPITLSYHSSLDQSWHVIEDELPNTGRYDWHVPADLVGQITVKIAVHDLGGHVVERSYGPIALDDWMTATPMQQAPATQPTTEPAAANAPEPAPAAVSRADRQRAEQLYQQGSWHLVKGQYAVAAERFREALEADPDMLSALSDLAGIHYVQKDYAGAIEHYQRVLERNQQHPAALRGAALAYVAQRKYAQSRDMLQRLLAADNKDAEAWLDLGDVLFMMGDQTAAVSHWRQAVAVNAAGPSDPAAREISNKARRRLQLYGSTAAVRTADASGK